MPPPINKPIVKLMEKPIEQPKVVLKVPILENSRIHDKIVPIPDYPIPQTRSGDDSSSRMVKKKTMQGVSREIPIYPDSTYRPPPKPVELPIPEVPRSLSDFYPEIYMDFEKHSPFQEGVISEMYQRPDNSYFQEPQELDSLINTGKLVQKFLPKQADMDQILKIIQRKFSKEHIYL